MITGTNVLDNLQDCGIEIDLGTADDWTGMYHVVS